MLQRLATLLNSRAYPGSELVVANTLAKCKKLEPNGIDFSHGFSQKVVSINCSVLNSLPASGDFCHLLITFVISSDPDQARQHVGSDLDPNCLTPWWYWKKSSIQRVKYGTIIQCEWIIQTKRWPKYTFFCRYVILNHIVSYFSQWLIFVATLHF